KDPNDRYHSITAFAKDIRHIIDDRSISICRDNPIAAILRWTRHNRGRSIAIVALLVFIAAAAITTSSIQTIMAEQKADAAHARHALILKAQQATKKQLIAEQTQLQQERALRKKHQLNSQAYMHYMQAQDLINRKDKQQLAIDKLHSAIDLNPRFIEALFARALAYRAQGKSDLALADYILCNNYCIQDTGTGHAHALSTAGDIWRDRTDGLADAAAALGFYRQASLIDAENPYVHFAKTLVSYMHGDKKTALEQAHACVAQYPEYWESHYLLGYMYIGRNQQGDKQVTAPQNVKAIESYSHAIQLRPSMAKLYQNRGSAYIDWFQKERNTIHLQAAIQDYNFAAMLNPQNPIMWSMLYKIHFTHSKNYVLALQAANKLEKISAHAHNYSAMRAYCFAGLQRYEDSLSAINKALQSTPLDASLIKLKSDIEKKINKSNAPKASDNIDDSDDTFDPP
ncbi:MAG: hypothetical protein HRU15_05670, partial [Planctomycetes bacterium]|nr:hypothetical protein [Planctomycetota bacterium]